MTNIANAIKAKYELAFNSVDVIPPAYPCDKERIVVLAVSAKKTVPDSLRLFCRDLTKARAQNVALLIDGDKTVSDQLGSILTEAGTNLVSEPLFVKCGLFGSSPSPEEKTMIFSWIDRIIQNLQ
ncbi:MAG: hypothetical protein MJ078_07915 [Clostridia bacterium]|nr:hypothetical protein [Clostridia bacterium]